MANRAGEKWKWPTVLERGWWHMVGEKGRGGGKPCWRGGGCKPWGRKEEEVANRGLGTGNHTSTGSTDFHDFHVSLNEFFDFHDFLDLHVEL